ncbi:MAG TPA: kelch repeat-containing protein [Nitrospiraceae bacterium]|nr:kelch repeat-containing protein [Nitrospiraceae bacterium]
MPQTNNLTSARGYHTATLLPNGTVLVAGGNGSNGLLTSAEVYNPATGQWTATGNLTVARAGHTATLLPNGTVLVAGGFGDTGPLASSEILMPSNTVQATLTWDPSTDPSVRGYKVYYGTASRNYQQVIDVNLSTTYAFSTLKSGTTYYFSVTAYNIVAESCSSNEVNKTIP